MASLFISYRRADSGGQVGRLVDRLSADKTFRHGGIFLDVNPDAIELGADFRDRIRAGIGLSSVVLAVIGNQWLTIRQGDRRRLDIENDPVREEIAFALRRRVTLIPVLVGDASMPKAEELPEALRPLADLNGSALSDARFDNDLAPLAERVKRLCEEAAGSPPADVPAETFFALGLDKLLVRDLQNAKACFTTATRVKPDFGAAYVHLATTLQLEAFDRISENNYGLALERLAQAQQALKEALPHVGADASLLVQMGYVYKDLVQSYQPVGRNIEANGAYESARYHFELALGHDPRNASALNGLASIAIAHEDYETAIRRSRSAIQLQRGYVAARHDLAMAYYGKARGERDPRRRLEAMRGFLDTWKELIKVLAEPESEQLPQKALDNLQYIASVISREVGKLERGRRAVATQGRKAPSRSPAARGARKTGRAPRKGKPGTR